MTAPRSPPARTSAGVGSTLLWLPGTTHRPPSPANCHAALTALAKMRPFCWWYHSEGENGSPPPCSSASVRSSPVSSRGPWSSRNRVPHSSFSRATTAGWTSRRRNGSRWGSGQPSMPAAAAGVPATASMARLQASTSAARSAPGTTT